MIARSNVHGKKRAFTISKIVRVWNTLSSILSGNEMKRSPVYKRSQLLKHYC